MCISALSFRRLLALTTALTIGVPAMPAFAQDAAAPPSRVGQIAMLEGNVSFDGSGSGGWAQAALNYPVSAGDTLYTQDNSRAAIALNASQITLADDTELQVTALDQNSFAATQGQGEAVYVINDLQPGQDFTVATPRGTVAITQNGQYEIAAGDANDPTTVNVFQGLASVTDPGAHLQVTGGQAASLTGTDQTVAQIVQARQDQFAASVLAQNVPAAPPYVPSVVQQMTGTAELSQYGSWNQSPQYGAVWYPSVAPGWAPYRQGHWANIQPWGWTWVESEPWGFAPFHYGRWIDDGDRWGWAPAYAEGGYGASYQPVYAPAVVSFFGIGIAAGITAAALSSGSVGWVPLAPNEPYYPSYRAPPGYIRQINYVNVRNINTINVSNNYYGGNFDPGKLANRRGATFVPADVMSRGEHVAGYAHPASQTMLSAARPVETGFGHSTTSQQAGFRLPAASRPLAELRPGTAPRPNEFAQRRSLPPAMVSSPPSGAPSGLAPDHAAMPQQHQMPPSAANRPGFVTAPGFQAPPAPPRVGQQSVPLPPANFHPGEPIHAMPHVVYPSENPAFHPQNQPHPQPVQAYHPPAAFNHGPAEPLHPTIQAPHPAAEPFQPPAPILRPQVQPFHPQALAQPRPLEMPRAQPAPHLELSHPEPQNHPG